MKLEHPITKKMYTTLEAAEIIGIHPATLCNRRRKGQTGEQLWRPSESQEFKSTLPSNKLGIAQDKLLRAMPSETEFDKKANDDSLNSSSGYIHSEYNRI